MNLYKAYMADQLHLDYAIPGICNWTLEYEREVMLWLSWLKGEGSRSRLTLCNNLAGAEAVGVDQESDWFGYIGAGDTFEIVTHSPRGQRLSAMLFTVGRVVSRRDLPRGMYRSSKVILEGYAEEVPPVLHTHTALEVSDDLLQAGAETRAQTAY